MKKIEKLQTYEERRSQYLGATNGEETDLRNETIDDVCYKINEIIDVINKEIK